jgi:hypothetical protein
MTGATAALLAPGANSRPLRAAQVLFWRLPYRLRRKVFRQLRPGLAAHYDRMLHGQARDYSLVPMIERGCLFVHIPKCAGVAVSRALFGGLGGGHLPVAHYQLMFDAAQYARHFKFAVVRNPYDRLLSAYRFLAGGGTNAVDAAWAARNLVRRVLGHYYNPIRRRMVARQPARRVVLNKRTTAQCRRLEAMPVVRAFPFHARAGGTPQPRIFCGRRLRPEKPHRQRHGHSRTPSHLEHT